MGFWDRLRASIETNEPELVDEVSQTKTGQWTNHAGGYWVCSHSGCSKKADDAITDHDCCGRCNRGRTCRQGAAANYTGPGTFFHGFSEAGRTGQCTVCGQPREDHSG